MEPVNVEVVRRFVEAINAGEPEREIVHYDPGVVFDWTRSQSPYRGSYQGLEAVARWLHEVRGAWSDFRFEPQDFTEVGDECVVVSNRITGRGRLSGVEVAGEGAQVWTFAEGRPVRVELYQSKAEAFDALGLGDG